ncbi:MAG: Hsp20/alpha crystallin family protein [Bacteroidales bacterium]|jgi:HSP20 family protein|nr:Hsp20/alpha crystallin family protein [Bacteroidales bacterium]
MKLIKRNDDWGFPSVWEDFFNNDLFNLPAMASRGATVPAVNINETDKEFELELAAPGLKKNDFKVNIDRNVLTVSTEKKEEKEEKDKSFTRKEFSYHSFSRSFTLPESINQEKIDAKYTDGVLKLVLPKKEEVIPKSKEIKIA